MVEGDCRAAVRNVVYLIRHRETGKSYVGQTTETARRRWGAHVNKALAEEGQSYSTRTAIARAMRKHGHHNFDFAILEVCLPEELDAREAHWIATLGTMRPAGYNLTAGGCNAPRGPEVGAKISAANKGRVKTPEWRAKLSAAHKGKKLSAEHCAKITAVQLGRKQTPEHIASRVAGMTGKKRGPYSDEHRAAIAAGMSEEGKVRTRAAHIGAKRSEETIAKLKAAWVLRKAA